MKPRKIVKDKTNKSHINQDAKSSAGIADEKSADATVDLKGGTYKKILKAMHFQIAPKLTTTNQETIIHSEPFSKKAKKQEPDKVESNLKIRPDSTNAK